MYTDPPRQTFEFVGGYFSLLFGEFFLFSSKISKPVRLLRLRATVCFVLRLLPAVK